MLHTCRGRSLALAGGCAVLLFSTARSADAQPQPSEGVYVSASALVEVKRFSGDPTTNKLDGQAFGGAFALGTSLGTRWDLEVGVDTARVTADVQQRSVTVQRKTITLQSRTRNRAMSVATLIRLRTAPHGRVQVGYLGGLSFVRLQRQFDTLAPAGTAAALVPRPFETVDYGAAPTVGIDARVVIAAHLSVVPAIHVSAFDFHDTSGVLVRPRIGIRCTF